MLLFISAIIKPFPMAGLFIDVIGMASDILEILEKDEKLRKKLSKLVASEILLDPEIRLTLVEKSLELLATKKDLRETEERLRAEIRETEERLRAEIATIKEELKGYVDVRVADLQKSMQIGFTVLGIMIAGFALLVGLR